MTTRIPGVSRILAVSAASIPADIADRARRGLPAVFAADAVEICFVDMPECVVTCEAGRSGSSDGGTLSFISPEVPRLPAGALAWLVYDQHGNVTLLGRRHAPHPRLTVESTTGEISGRSGARCKVTCLTPPVSVQPLILMTD